VKPQRMKEKDTKALLNLYSSGRGFEKIERFFLF